MSCVRDVLLFFVLVWTVESGHKNNKCEQYGITWGWQRSEHLHGKILESWLNQD